MKRRFLLLGLLVVIVALAAFFFTRRQTPPAPAAPSPTPYALPTVNSWNGVTPGVSTASDLSKLGAPTGTVQSGSVTTYSFPSANQYWKNEVDITNNTVVFIRERIFPPTNTSLKGLTAKLTENPTKLFGPDYSSGMSLFVYPAQGIAFLANDARDTTYQIWRFPATTIAGFLSLPQAARYGTAPTGQPEGI